MNFGTILAQSRPTDTNATSIYSPGAGEKAKITRVVVCETSGGAMTFSIFLDNDGTTYDQTTALYYGTALSANTVTLIEADWWMDNSSGNLAVKSGTGSAVTYTVFGEVTGV
jgi:hypothetical protein